MSYCFETHLHAESKLEWEFQPDCLQELTSHLRALRGSTSKDIGLHIKFTG